MKQKKKILSILFVSFLLSNIIYSNSEETSRIIEESTARIKANPDNLMLYYYRGSKYFKIKQYDNAESDFDKAIALDKKNTGVAVRQLKAKVMLLTGREYESIKFLSEAINQKSALCYFYQRALGYDYIGEFDKAVIDYTLYVSNENIKNFPTEYKFAFERLLTLLLYENKINDAKDLLANNKLKSQDDYYLLYLMAYIDYKENKLKSARKYLEKTVELKRDMSVAYVLLALVDAAENNQIDSLGNLKKAIACGYDEIELISKIVFLKDSDNMAILAEIENNKILKKNCYQVYKDNSLLLKINIEQEAKLYSDQEL